MEYQLIRSRRKSLSAEIRNGELIVRAPLRASKQEIDRFLQAHLNWIHKHLNRAEKQERAAQTEGRFTEEEIQALEKRAKAVFAQRAAYYAPLVGVTYGRISVRCQKTRWGSCSSKGNLNFNCLLLLTPPEVLDSVVVHELCHRKEMNHSPRFYEEVLRVFPAYRKWDRWLKENGGVLLRRAGK